MSSRTILCGTLLCNFSTGRMWGLKTIGVICMLRKIQFEEPNYALLKSVVGWGMKGGKETME